jgi:hypothetical protein
VSPATIGSCVWKKTWAPSWEAPSNSESNAPFPPAGPVEMRVVVPPERS